MPSIDRPRAGRGEPSKFRTASSSKPPTQQHQLTKVAPSLALNSSAGSSSAMALAPPPYKFSRPRSSRWAARRRADECGHGLANVGHNCIGLSSAHCRFRGVSISLFVDAGAELGACPSSFTHEQRREPGSGEVAERVGRHLAGTGRSGDAREAKAPHGAVRGRNKEASLVLRGSYSESVARTAQGVGQ